jgi:hypothetical protein
MAEPSSWLLEPLPLWTLLFLGVVPGVIAHARGRPVVTWCIYGLSAALFAWPLVVVPTVHALLVHPRGRFMTKEQRERQRRADALALIKEPGLRTFPSRVTELRRLSPAGVDRRRYVYEHIKPGDVIELVRESSHPRNGRATAYYHRGTHLGYVPRRQSWVADALDDGLRLAVIVERVRMSWFRRQRARSVHTCLVIFYDGH